MIFRKYLEMIKPDANQYLDTSAERIRKILESNDAQSELLRRNAFRLILEAMNDKEKREITTIEDLKCLPISLWILRRLDEPLLTSRVINHSRDILESFLLGKSVPDDYVPDYGRIYGVNSDYDELLGLYKIRVGEFVNLSARLTGYRYRLVYQSMRNGYVYCDREVEVKIIREGFVKSLFSIYEKLPEDESYTLTIPIGERIDELFEIFQKSGIKQSIDLGDVDASLFPPCIKEYISLMRDGVNLPHMARFTFVSFLHKAGMDNNGIIELFKTAPDFNEKLTTYQVNHITGEISSTEYSPPKCTVLRSNHLCYWDDDPLCHKEWLRHPLQYYTYKKKKKSGQLSLNKLQKS